MAKNFTTSIIINGDSKDAVRAIRGVVTELGKLDKSVASSNAVLAQASRALTSLGKVAATALTVGVAAASTALIGLVKHGLEAADVMGKSAEQLGISVEAYQALALGADLANVSMTALDSAFKKQAKTIVEAANGSKKAQKALADLGLTATELLELSPDQQFAKIADGLNKIDNASRRAAVAQAVFGRAGVNLLNLTKEGSDGLAAFAEQARILGLDLNRVEVDKIEDANDAVTRIKAGFSGFGQQLALQFAPVIQDLAEELLAVIERAGGMRRVAEDAFNAITNAAQLTVDVLRGLRDVAAVAIPPALAIGLGTLVGRFVQLQLAARASTVAVGAGLAGLAVQSRALIASMNAAGGAAASMSIRLGVLARAFALIGGWPGIIATALFAAIPAWFAWGSAAEDAAGQADQALTEIHQRVARTGETEQEAAQALIAERKAQLEQLKRELQVARDAAAAVDSPLLLGREFGGLRAQAENQLAAAERRVVEIQGRIAATEQELAAAEAREKRIRERAEREAAAAAAQGGVVPGVPDTTETAKQVAAAKARIESIAAAEQAALAQRQANADLLFQQGQAGERQNLEAKRAFALEEIAIEERKQQQILVLERRHQQALLDAARGAGDTAAADKAEAEIARISAEQEQAAAQVAAKRTELETKAAADRVEIERRAQAAITAVEVAGMREQVDAERRKAGSIVDIQAAALRQRQQLVQAFTREFFSEHQLEIDRLIADGAAGLRQLQALLKEFAQGVARIEEQEADNLLSLIEGRIARVLEQQRALEERAAARVQAGVETPATARETVLDGASEAQAKLLELRSALQALAQQDVPGAAEAIQRLDTEMLELAAQGATGMQRAIIDLRGELQNLSDNFARDNAFAVRDNLGRFFTDITTGSKSAKEAVEDFARGVAEDLASVAAQALATQIIVSILDKIGIAKPSGPDPGKAAAAGVAFATPVLGASTALGIAGGIVETAGASILAGARALASAASLLLVANSTSASVAHTGGIIGSTPLPTRRVSPFLFAGAARYHSGGIAGLRAGEVPAILRKGEEVLTQENPRHIANQAGAQRASGDTFLLVDDRARVPEAMDSAAGDRVWLVQLERNASAAKQILGG
jgi:hypothetical protein